MELSKVDINFKKSISLQNDLLLWLNNEHLPESPPNRGPDKDLVSKQANKVEETDDSQVGATV